MKVTIGKKEYELPQYKLRELELAAPHLDALRDHADAQARAIAAGEKPSVVAMTQSMRHVLGVIAAGLSREDRSWTVDRIMEEMSFEEFQAMRGAIPEIQREAGMISAGEPRRVSQPDTAGSQPVVDRPSAASDESSPSSSQPGAPEGAGTP